VGVVEETCGDGWDGGDQPSPTARAATAAAAMVSGATPAHPRLFAPVMDTTAEEFRRVTEATYLG